MRQTAILLIAASGLLACGSPGGFSRQAPAVEFKDLHGNSRSLTNLDKPAVVGFWISDCGYCRNMLAILDSISAKNGDSVEAYGIYLNDVPESDIAAAAAQEGFSGIVAAAQQSPETLKAFLEAFGIRGVGRDVYVIDRTGAFRRVALVDLGDQFVPQADVEAKVQELIDGTGDLPAAASGGTGESLID
jgi:thiol-disulfide isomerase/thioredoxin